MLEKQYWAIAKAVKDYVCKIHKIRKLKTFNKLLPTHEWAEDSKGLCDYNGNIYVEIRNLDTGKLHCIYDIMDTVCHELAHLTDMTHGTTWRKTYKLYLRSVQKHLHIVKYTRTKR